MAALAEGSKGSGVKKLQNDLNTVISAGLKATGTFDVKTKDAVIKFQKKVGLSANGTVDTKTQKSLKLHVSGLDWPHGDPAADQKSVKDALANIKKQWPESIKKLTEAEAECRAAADILKKNIAKMETYSQTTVSGWTEMASLLGEGAALKKDFDAAKKVHDLATQKDILAKAKALQEKIDKAHKKGGDAFTGGANPRRACLDALGRVAKLEGNVRNTKELKCAA